MSDDTVANWVAEIQRGDSRAAQEIWERYFSQLARLAGQRLGGLPRRAADEEDIAISAMNSFVQGAREGRFPRLDDETDLWRLLVTITARKVSAQRRAHLAVRRGGGKVRGESGLGDPTDTSGLAMVMGREPTPQFAAQVTEQYELLLERLDDPVLRDIAVWKLEGFSNEEIAEKLQRNVRTVERKLALIRENWSLPD